MTIPSRDPLLDGWRGVSVLAVLFGHGLRFRFGPYFPAPTFREILNDSHSGHLMFTYVANRFAEVCAGIGVQIFFVISGYIITKLLLREKSERSQISLTAFYIRRSFRILPPFFVYLGVCFLLWHFECISLSPNDFYAAITFTCNLMLLPHGWFVTHIWSLSIEEQFYLVWPMLVTILPNDKRTFFLFLIILLLTATTLAGQSLRNSVSFTCIAMGALYACSPELQRFIEKWASVWGVIAVMSTLFISVYLHSFVTLYRAIQCLLPMGILYVVFSAQHLRLIRHQLEARVIGQIGLFSYSLYLWQQLFLAWPTEYLRIIPPIWLLPIVATASYFLLERPMIAIGRRLSKKLQSTTSAKMTVDFGTQTIHTT